MKSKALGLGRAAPCWSFCSSSSRQFKLVGLVGLVPRPRRRHASTVSFPDGGSRRVRGDDSTRAVIACRDPAQCTPDELLSLVSPADKTPATAILLVSKAFSPWIAFDDSFLSGFVSRLSTLSHAPPKLSLLAAVVDRLPSPSSQWPKHPSDELISLQKDHGLQGLAYIASPNQHLFASLSSNLAAAGPATASSLRPDVATSSESPPCLSFELYDHVSVGSDTPIVHTSITLPLANTVFETGQPATAIFSEWVPTAAGDWTAQSRQNVAFENQLVALQATTNENADRPVETDGDSNFSTHLSLPLDPLVPGRRVESAMGNIITKVSGSATDNSPSPASAELEAAVANYFSSRNIDPSVIAVWCLIIPKQVVESHATLVDEAQQLWTRGGAIPRSNHYISRLLWSGATLRKVLSGGGGWGQKAGLLSIDPEQDYVAKKASIPSFLASLHDPEEESVYPDITRQGDVIAFFAAPESDDMFGGDNDIGTTPTSEDAASLDFGVLPSTMDGDRYAEDGAGVGRDTTDFEIFNDHFGALSEGGMSVAMPSAESAAEKQRVRTKVDVPFARLSYQSQASSASTVKKSKP